jgi:UDP-2-acetamido-3-amino-2,3-dideoxy-glucuronate N-acetyltransferase
MTPNVVVVGNGYWGKNLVRIFHEQGALAYVCDIRPDALRQAQTQYGARVVSSLGPVLSDDSVKGIAIAAPAAQHFTLAKQCLLAGKDVYVEKPLALKVQEGKELVRIAAEHEHILMVGHILQYHPAIIALKQLIQSGELGNIQYIYSSRLNLGKLRTEENILWSFAPHDISAILYLLGESPVRVCASGGCYLRRDIFDATLTTCEFASGAKAHIFVSWMHPFKEQKLTIVGGKKMAVFDDLEPERKLTLYSHHIDWIDRVPTARKDDGVCVPLAKDEPLRRECHHFLECIENRTTPQTDGNSGIAVLEVLEASERSLQEGSKQIEIGSDADYFAHPTAVIDPGCRIGHGTHIWHFSHIMPDCRIGDDCNIGQNVVISPGVTVGRNVKIQNNVSVYTGVVLEDNVFCGPSMVFTNVVNPRSHVLRKHEYRDTLVREGASIGANATVVCGVTLGRYSFVAAGSVVTHDVPEYALVMGVPARQVGWMCYCGVRLPKEMGVVRCTACARSYEVSAHSCVAVTGVAAASVAPSRKAA